VFRKAAAVALGITGTIIYQRLTKKADAASPTTKALLSRADHSKKRVIMVTGGTGLVGNGIKAALKDDPEAANESWIYLSSKDGDLRDAVHQSSSSRVQAPVSSRVVSSPITRD
jgi:hypothetical protein